MIQTESDIQIERHATLSANFAQFLDAANPAGLTLFPRAS
jgi:hypothetical protein